MTGVKNLMKQRMSSRSWADMRGPRQVIPNAGWLVEETDMEYRKDIPHTNPAVRFF